jgi:hypothetical protein
MAKRKLSKEKLEDRAWGREERRHAWMAGGRGTPFQAEIASLVDGQITPAELRHIIALAWSPHHAALQNIIAEACHDPGPDGLERATVAARTVWNHVMGEPPQQGGWPERLGDKLQVWVNFNTALLKAQQRGKVVKTAAMSDFVKQHGRSQPWPVNTVAALRKILGQVERATSQEFRDALMFCLFKALEKRLLRLRR